MVYQAFTNDWSNSWQVKKNLYCVVICAHYQRRSDLKVVCIIPTSAFKLYLTWISSFLFAWEEYPVLSSIQWNNIWIFTCLHRTHHIDKGRTNLDVIATRPIHNHFPFRWITSDEGFSLFPTFAPLFFLPHFFLLSIPGVPSSLPASLPFTSVSVPLPHRYLTTKS